MIIINNISLLGRIGKDIDLRFTAGSGTAVAKFTLAVKRPFKKDETDWLNCVVFGKTAEVIVEHFANGSQIAVWGYIQTGSYEKDGVKRYTTDVIVQGFDFVGAKEVGAQVNNTFTQDELEPVDDGDIPF